jgi:hypothetical protein
MLAGRPGDEADELSAIVEFGAKTGKEYPQMETVACHSTNIIEWCQKVCNCSAEAL